MSFNAVKEILHRLPANHPEIRFELLKDDNGFDTFEIVSVNRTALIRANNNVAAARGLYEYLREFCGLNFTWSGQNISAAKDLPLNYFKRVETPYKYRLYMNMCTFSYSTVWWDWERWQRELDWMALHGINMPLALIGQEYVWQKIWNELGISNHQLEDFFTGPAYLAWNRCGNLNGFAGPLPQNWIENQCKLQFKILERMRELDMDPIVPTFSGYVPDVFTSIYTNEAVTKSMRWAEFDDRYRTQLLSPQSTMFGKISQLFIKEYSKAYGPCKYYLADIFHENCPNDLKNDTLKQLAEYGELVFKGIKSGNPQGVWVMQGWSFYFNGSFWNNNNVRALFSRVPNDEVIVIDLCNEKFQGWQKFDEFYEKKWIYSFVHNFGGNDPLNGDLNLFAQSREPILNANVHPAGFGISPEGIENNEVVYELLADAAWNQNKIDIAQWIKTYCIYRYGKFNTGLKKAWDILLKTTYNKSHANIKHGFQGRPAEKLVSSVAYSEEIFEALRIIVEMLDEFKGNKFYIFDAIELIGQCAGIVCDKHLQSCIDKKNSANAEEAFDLLTRIDTLISQIPHRNLTEWIESARKNAGKQEADYYENNARRLLTIWGGKILADYAARMWGGLISGFYVERLKSFFESMDNNEAFDASAWEENWVNSTIPIKPIFIDDVPAYIKETYALIEKLHKKSNDQNQNINKVKIGKWAFTDNALKSLKLDITRYIPGISKFIICFEETAKYLLPKISKFYLYENQDLLLDVRETGKGFFCINLDHKPGADYGIEVVFDNDEAHGSCGSILIQYGVDIEKQKKINVKNCKIA
jgi:alpha-N-acetylglucosaminidase